MYFCNNFEALRWGLLGTFIKGSIWIGFFGLFLGLGLSKINYKFIEIALAMISAIFMLYIGIFLLNEPFDPTAKKLPMIKYNKFMWITLDVLIVQMNVQCYITITNYTHWVYLI